MCQCVLLAAGLVPWPASSMSAAQTEAIHRAQRCYRVVDELRMHARQSQCSPVLPACWRTDYELLWGGQASVCLKGCHASRGVQRPVSMSPWPPVGSQYAISCMLAARSSVLRVIASWPPLPDGRPRAPPARRPDSVHAMATDSGARPTCPSTAEGYTSRQRQVKSRWHRVRALRSKDRVSAAAACEVLP